MKLQDIIDFIIKLFTFYKKRKQEKEPEDVGYEAANPKRHDDA